MNLPIDLHGKTVLVAGCGGGYDVVCALPVALQLARQGCRVHLASSSFTRLSEVTGAAQRPGPVWVVGPRTTGPEYFPEGHLSRWLAENEPGISPEIFCYAGLAVQPLKEVFDALARDLGIEALLVVDGGVDGLFRGDEYDLGTPSIDAISMIAGALSSVPASYYVMTAFGTEGVNKEVSHAQALERIADVTRLGGFCGVCALAPGDEVVRGFEAGVRWMYAATSRIHQSNMVGSLLAALQGRFGDLAVTSKTEVHPVWVSPLTSLYWFLDLGTTARLKQYFDAIADSREYSQATGPIGAYLEASEERKRGEKPPIPI